MKIEGELWHLVLLALAWFGAIWAFWTLFQAKSEKSLDERFAAIDKAREEGAVLLRQMIRDHLDEERKNGEHMIRLERELMSFKADMPLHYVRREDYIRGQSVIEAKLDALYAKLEVAQLRGQKHDS